MKAAPCSRSLYDFHPSLGTGIYANSQKKCAVLDGAILCAGIRQSEVVMNLCKAC